MDYKSLSAGLLILLVSVLITCCSYGLSAKPHIGLWLTPHKDSSNNSRADVPGRMTAAPREVWSFSTGGVIDFAQDLHVDKRDCLLVLAGNVLQLRTWSGESIWRQSRMGITRVLHVGNFDGNTNNGEVLVGTDDRTVVLLDLTTGQELWRWQSEPGTFIGCRQAEPTSFTGGYKFYRTAAGIRFICFPTYSTKGVCFDFAGKRERPRMLWQHDYGNKYVAGPGPAVILKDMNGDGRPEIVLSGRTTDIYQSIIDLETGAPRQEVRFNAQSGASCGRPYGLLQAYSPAPGQPNEVALVSCQVEEYLSDTAMSRDGRLYKRWGKFIEKDWPKDDLELRPQITSFSELKAKGLTELVLGLWDGSVWETLVIDPRRSFDAKRGSLKNLYFWGCYDLDADGSLEILVSRETKRQTARQTTLLALSGKTLEPVAKLENAAVFVSTDSPLPDEIAFGAVRRNPIFLRTKDGSTGILIHLFDGNTKSGTAFWGAKTGRPIRTCRFAGPEFVRADLRGNRLLLSDGSGGIQRFDDELKPLEKLSIHGRVCRPLVWAQGVRRELILDLSDETILGGVPNLHSTGGISPSWKVRGSMAAAHVDASGCARLTVCDTTDSDRPQALIYTAPLSSESQPLRIPLSHPPYLGLLPFGDVFRLLVNRRTGVHTMALSCFDSNGHLLWKDDEHGAHPRLPAAADLGDDGLWEVIADDHGVLRIYSDSGKVTGINNGWPPAYTSPVVGKFGPSGRNSILRTSGMSGISLADKNAANLWLVKVPDWRHYQSFVAIAKTATGVLTFSSLAEDGTLECFDAASGKLRWSLNLGCTPNSTSLAAGDLDGDGADEFVLGLKDGRLICLKEIFGQGSIFWETQFDASVANPIIVDVDADGFAEIIVSTSDGFARILKSD